MRNFVKDTSSIFLIEAKNMFEPNVLICVINKISTNLNSFSNLGNDWCTFDKQKKSLNLKKMFNEFFVSTLCEGSHFV